MMFSSSKVQKVVEECETLIAGKDDAYSIDRPSAVFLYEVALMRRAKTILEIGGSYGHSGLFLADAALRNHGKFWTVEKEERKVRVIRHYMLQAGLESVATVLEGEAPGVLDKAPQQIDLLFIDATKSEQDAYLDFLWPRLSDRAVIVTDNVTSHAAEMAGFLKRLQGDSRLLSTTVQVGHGMELSLKIA